MFIFKADYLLTEVKLLQSIKHPFVIKFYGSFQVNFFFFRLEGKGGYPMRKLNLIVASISQKVFGPTSNATSLLGNDQKTEKNKVTVEYSRFLVHKL